jgi:hypothetical protein
LKTYVDGSLNTINTNKQNKFTCITPLIKNDISNNISIDLSSYPLKTYVDGSLNTINTTLGTKQNNLTFSNPILNTSNTITLKYNSAQFNIDALGNLSLVSTVSSQWTTSGTKIYYNSGNVGIGTTNPVNILQVGGAGRLRIANSTSDYSLIGTADTDGATNTRIVVSGNARTSFLGNIDYVATNTGSHIFYTTDANTERMRISSDGTVNIVNKLQIAGNDINNFLFNNTGRNHATYTDFNSIDKFGYTYIQAGTNSPNTGSSQYYS